MPHLSKPYLYYNPLQSSAFPVLSHLDCQLQHIPMLVPNHPFFQMLLHSKQTSMTIPLQNTKQPRSYSACVFFSLFLLSFHFSFSFYYLSIIAFPHIKVKERQHNCMLPASFLSLFYSIYIFYDLIQCYSVKQRCISSIDSNSKDKGDKSYLQKERQHI